MLVLLPYYSARPEAAVASVATFVESPEALQSIKTILRLIVIFWSHDKPPVPDDMVMILVHSHNQGSPPLFRNAGIHKLSCLNWSFAAQIL